MRAHAHCQGASAVFPRDHARNGVATGAQLNRNGRSVTFGNAVRKGGLLRGERSGFAGCGMLPWPEPFLLKRGQRQQKSAMTPWFGFKGKPRGMDQRADAPILLKSRNSISVPPPLGKLRGPVCTALGGTKGWRHARSLAGCQGKARKQAVAVPRACPADACRGVPDGRNSRNSAGCIWAHAADRGAPGAAMDRSPLVACRRDRQGQAAALGSLTVIRFPADGQFLRAECGPPQKQRLFPPDR